MNQVEKRNIICNTFGEGLWGLGWNMAAPLTVLPIIIKGLGGSTFEVGVLAALVSAGAFAPQILSSLVLQNGQGKKRFLIWFHLYAVVPPWVLMSVTMAVFAERNPTASRFLLIALISFSVFSIGFILPIWLDWIAGLFQKKIRGLAFGFSGSASAAGGSVAALIAAGLTASLPYPFNYTVLFLVASAVLFCSMITFTFMRIVDNQIRPAVSRRDYIGKFRQSLASGNFRRYLVSRSMIAFGASSVSFYAVHYLSDAGGGLQSKTVIGLGALILVAQSSCSAFIGRLGDRVGHRIGIMIGAAAQSSSLLMVILAPGPVSCGIAFGLTGISLAAATVSHQNFLFETCPHDSRTAHITVANLALAPITVFAPLIVGKAIELAPTAWVLGVCLAFTVFGFIWLAVFVRNPDSPSPAELAA